ncbi:hypothetical protein LG358_00111 [Escherichia phage UoN_LG358_1]|nr:hypothetical protein LG358_00111 [Escherichia phage UoN_LG358_1]
MGGLDTSDNLVKLTYREHFIAHWLLFKIHKNKEMSYALNRIMNSGTIFRSKLYEIARKNYVNMISDWSAEFMRDKILLRNKETGECRLLTKGEYTEEDWVGVNYGRKFEGVKGYGVYKDKDNTTYRLRTDDPLIKDLGLCGVGNTLNATKVAAALEKSKPWYNKSKTNPDAVKLIPSLYDWYANVYDPVSYKKTGIAKWKTVNNITIKTKLFKIAFNQFKNGWTPDEKFYEVLNEIC